MRKSILSILLLFLLAVCLAVPSFAEETPEQTRELHITTTEEFLSFGESCRLDAYSRNLTVYLETDIDLTGTGFQGIPIFCGSFLGQDHSISGLCLTIEGSCLGLFRHLTQDALVQDLTLSGQLHPGGSRSQIGALAGRNEGTIRNCVFSGSISGGDELGGIAGTNEVTGIIENCRTEGNIHGDHFVGGIAGTNRGVIRGCTNHSRINTTPQQNSIEISDITMDTLTNTEAVNTVTDIGGIAGISSGVIRQCRNLAAVGYRHMGYNIGGIAGTHSGYLTDCENHGSIQGRKEVGGIVGQAEPTSLIEYAEDTLQILQGQLDTMSGMVSQAASNAQTNASQLQSQISVLKDQAATAREAVDILLPSLEDPSLPDTDTILAAQNALSDSLGSMPGTLRGITAATKSTANSLARDMNALSGQINAMGATIRGASETLGGTITDVSDLDTAELLTGKTENCTNFGSVLGDLNVGGIAGAMSVETDLDVVEDWLQSGETSMNFEAELRAVVLSCTNSGTVTGKKQNVGGITGWQSLGLVKLCTNTGTVDGTGADYVGGISGLSTGFLRSNGAKCHIYGKTSVGGIAGSGTVVTDSLAQVRLGEGQEKLGAILGTAEDPLSSVEDPLRDNYYLWVDRDPGGIDGVSYSGLAQPLSPDTERDTLPSLFRNVSIRFLFADGTTRDVTLPAGGTLSPSQIPPVPEKEGFLGSWDGLDQAQLTDITFDMTFAAAYSPRLTAIESLQTGRNGLPMALAEGSFTDAATLSAIPAGAVRALPENHTLLDARTLQLSEPATALRLLVPENADSSRLCLYLLEENGTAQALPFTLDGSYLVFDAHRQEMTLLLAEQAGSGASLPLLLLLFGGALLSLCVLHRRKKKNSPAPGT